MIDIEYYKMLYFKTYKVILMYRLGRLKMSDMAYGIQIGNYAVLDIIILDVLGVRAYGDFLNDTYNSLQQVLKISRHELEQIAL